MEVDEKFLKKLSILVRNKILTPEEACAVYFHKKGFVSEVEGEEKWYSYKEVENDISTLYNYWIIEERDKLPTGSYIKADVRGGMVHYHFNFTGIEALYRKIQREEEKFIEIEGETLYLNQNYFYINKIFRYSYEGAVGVEHEEKMIPAVLLSFNPTRIVRGKKKYLVRPATYDDFAKLVNSRVSIAKLYHAVKKVTKVKHLVIVDNKEKEAVPEDAYMLYHNYFQRYNIPVYVVLEGKEFVYEHKLLDKPFVLKRMLETAFAGIDPRLRDVYLGMGIKMPQKDWLLKYGTHIVNFDATNVGKTFGVEILGGSVWEGITVASLVGTATTNEIRESVINETNVLTAIDEIEAEKDEELYSKLLNLLKSGKTKVGKAAVAIETKTWSSITFNGNVKKVHEQDPSIRSKEFYETLRKISSNLEALASRISLFNFYQLKQVEGGRPTDLYSQIFDGLQEILGEYFAAFISKKWVRDLLLTPWSEHNRKMLEEVRTHIEGVVVSDILDLVVNLPANAFKLNTLALKITLWDWFIGLSQEEALGSKLVDYFLKSISPKRQEDFVQRFNYWKDFLERWNINSIQSFAESSMQVTEDFIKASLERASPRLLKVLKVIRAYLNDVPISNGFQIRWQDVMEDEKAKEEFKKYFSGYGTISVVIDKLRSKDRLLLESFGLRFVRGGLEVVYPEIVRKVLEIVEGLEILT